ncbi:LOW QUALITY PROTEIN: Glutamate dehydrogenase, NAD-specific [Parasponia andersonii]|uniref:Glutamate dehydrogenase, NAD-specific n=1 Tax=Parasponia andersonii TaxID=3476 RepID=A0A2P5C6B9_PARAD|nr:LOW QUALITY PROTEIN: Glutamate dehydrogenase, NAD-specific [Parasponia andersonii]
MHLVDLLNLRTGTAATRRRNIIINTSSNVTTSTLVHLGDDGVADALKLLHLVLKLISLSELVAVKPLNSSINGVLNLLLVSISKLGGNLLVLDSVPHVVVVLQGILGINLLLVLLILCLVFLRLLNHLLNFILGQSSLVVGDGDLVLLSCGLVLSRNINDTIGINVKADIDLRNTPGSWRNARKLKLSEQVVVPGSGSLTLINLDQHTRLVVRVCGEHLLLLGGNGCVPGNQYSHNTSSGLQTKRQRCNIQKQQILNLLVSFPTQNSSLDSGTISNSLIRVNALAKLLSIEEILQQLLNLWNSSGTTNKHYIMNGALVHLSISQTLLDGFHTFPEEIHVEFLKSGTGDS